MRGQILFGGKDVEQDTVQQVIVGSGIVFEQDIFELHDLHLYLVVPFAEDTDIVFGIFHPSQQVADVREDDLFFVRHVFMDLVNIIVEEFGDSESDVTRATGNCFRQFAADMRQPEVEEIIVCIMQIGDQRPERKAVVDLVDRA